MVYILKKLLVTGAIITLTVGSAMAQTTENNLKWITLGQDAATKIEQLIPGLLSENTLTNKGESDNKNLAQPLTRKNIKKVAVIRSINAKRLDTLSIYMHRLFNRCGGFLVHSNYQSAQTYVSQTQYFLNKAKHRALNDEQTEWLPY